MKTAVEASTSTCKGRQRKFRAAMRTSNLLLGIRLGRRHIGFRLHGRVAFSSCRLKAINFIPTRMADQHFFQVAPSVSWLSMLWRLLDRTPKEPALLPAEPQFPQQSPSPTGQAPRVAQVHHAQEYSSFLAHWFYEPTQSVVLCPPPSLFQRHLGQALLGVELRTHQQALVGIVFCWRAGVLCGQPTGLITWLCVHPSWRKKGVTNCLLRAMWKVAQPCPSFWFRNDGWLQSPLPPIWSETRIVRKRRGQQGYTLRQVSFDKYKSMIQTKWRQTNPTGLHMSISSNPPLLEVWELSSKGQACMVLCIQPTMERQRQTGESWCEVLAWASVTEVPTFSEQTYIEAICDSLPYTWIDAPSSLPHIDSLWLQGGRTTWCAVGLDPGTPFQRPILSLQAA